MRYVCYRSQLHNPYYGSVKFIPKRLWEVVPDAFGKSLPVSLGSHASRLRGGTSHAFGKTLPPPLGRRFGRFV